MPLKPSQKVTILNSYAVPRIIYKVNHGDIGSVELTILDGIIKTAVKVAPSHARNRLRLFNLSVSVTTYAAKLIH